MRLAKIRVSMNGENIAQMVRDLNGVRVNQCICFPLNVGRFPLSARFPLPRLLALPTEAWRGAEIRRHLAENGYVNLPGPYKILSCLLYTSDAADE